MRDEERAAERRLYESAVHLERAAYQRLRATWDGMLRRAAPDWDELSREQRWRVIASVRADAQEAVDDPDLIDRLVRDTLAGGVLDEMLKEAGHE